MPRTAARADVDGTLAYYLAEAGPDVALGFIVALERTYATISETPGVGSPRGAHELNLPALRSLQVRGYPWRVFYLEAHACVDVWRILHAKRVIPAWMEGEDPEAAS